MRILHRACVFILCLGTAFGVSAEIVRDQALLYTIAVQGVTLEMTPEEACEHLFAKGYTAGNIESFADWDTGGLELVRGDTASPEGLSRVTLARQPGRLTYVTETINRPRGQHFDVEGEIDRVKKHFGIVEEERTCRVERGACQVTNGQEQQRGLYIIQVWPTMRTTQLGFPYEPSSAPKAGEE